MPISHTNIPTIERPMARKTSAMINNDATNNKSDNASTGRPNPKSKRTTETTGRVLTRKRVALGDTADTTTSDTAITNDGRVESSSLPTSSLLSTPSCPATPTPMETSESTTNGTRAGQRLKKRSKFRNRTRNKKKKAMKQTTTSTSNGQPTEKTTASDVDKDTSPKTAHESETVDHQTEDTHLPVLSPHSISAPLSPIATTLTTTTTTDETENDVIPEGSATTDAATTTEDITDADISSPKDDTQAKDTKDAMEALVRIEVEFARFRQKLFDEKMETLHQEMVLIEKGLHPDQLEMMKGIEKKRNTRIETATAKRDMNRLAHQMRFESTVYQAELAFTHKRKDLRANIHQTLSKRRLKLNDEHMDITEVPDLQGASSAQRQYRFNQAYELQQSNLTTGFPRPPPIQGISDQTAHSDLMYIQGTLALEQSATSNSHSGQSPQSPLMFSTAPTTPSSASSSFSSACSSSGIIAPYYYQPMHKYKYTCMNNDVNLQPQQLQHGHKLNGIPMVDIHQDPATIL